MSDIPVTDQDFEDEDDGTEETDVELDAELDPEVTPETFDPDAAGIPSNTYITIRTSSGATQYVPATAPMTVRELINASGLAIQGAYDVYLDQNTVTQETIVPVGSTVTILGNVKGA